MGGPGYTQDIDGAKYAISGFQIIVGFALALTERRTRLSGCNTSRTLHVLLMDAQIVLVMMVRRFWFGWMCKCEWSLYVCVNGR